MPLFRELFNYNIEKKKEKIIAINFFLSNFYSLFIIEI